MQFVQLVRDAFLTALAAGLVFSCAAPRQSDGPILINPAGVSRGLSLSARLLRQPHDVPAPAAETRHRTFQAR